MASQRMSVGLPDGHAATGYVRLTLLTAAPACVFPSVLRGGKPAPGIGRVPSLERVDDPTPPRRHLPRHRVLVVVHGALEGEDRRQRNARPRPPDVQQAPDVFAAK